MTTVSSLYVHVPFCRHLCNYCDFYKQKFDAPHAQRETYARYLTESFERHESIMHERGMSWAPFETIYFGGGTPSLWDTEGAQFFSSLWGGKIPLAPRAEVTFEVDPGAWTEEGLKAWEKLGVNRYSVGTQSLDPHYLKVLDRAHDREETFRLLDRLKGRNFSVDFLLGAPRVGSERNVIAELEELLSFGPKHLSLYILQPAAGYKLKAKIPEDEWISQEYLRVSQFLTENGFHHYEVSNFALPGFEAKHNLKYWLGESVAGLGPTGTGYFAHSKEKAYRYKWKPSKAEIEPEELSKSELDLERIYLRLRLSQPFKANEITANSSFKELLGAWQSSGLVQKLGDSWRMTPKAWVVLDSLMGEYFQRVK